MVRLPSTMPRLMAWRIHQVAYVENLKPFRQSNFSTACMSPRLPSCTRSSSGTFDRLILLGDRHHESEVAVDEGFDRSVAGCGRPAELPLASHGEVRPVRQFDPRCAALLGRLGQPDLVVLAQQCVASDVVEVEADKVLVRATGHACWALALVSGSPGRMASERLPTTRLTASTTAARRPPRGSTPATRSIGGSRSPSASAMLQARPRGPPGGG